MAPPPQISENLDFPFEPSSYAHPKSSIQIQTSTTTHPC
ncbi:hypothetical protein SS1G_09463 [Sclerotinia sclerotiorum 1980 UF-70]|uniref:Uncharacterized protein n=1 Tax=Sclerotinia sclerotiorum (strain ATCC 18683 / 1980 / Ss-1) TaxID=665079 RepID=A7EVV4_SCLS1|nr:hypothetical protein SS1G_09463 [Sclerotinia sclerotiorum 1980 UF-70]EDN93596.1 hypothetical protein SS1G_09463 [Sclerotinia sclerotiorum 1980 UF-70]